MKINAENLSFRELNEKIRNSKSRKIEIENMLGQRYTGSGCTGKDIEIHGIPGNALGAYLTGSDITVYGNAQDAVGDAMNDGTITVHGNVGDAAGYGMRDGKILVKGSAGYRAGIHMKEYMEKKPLMVIGGKAGDFLAEYQASIEALLADPAAVSVMIESTGIFNKAPVAQKAIPNCNICFLKGEEMKEKMKNFLEIMYETAPQSIGGAIPGDDFYYIEG